MSGTDHKHPTFGVCTCGHLDFMHPWTTEQRVNYQGACIARTQTSAGSRVEFTECDCRAFHADGR